jgi:flotillin
VRATGLAEADAIARRAEALEQQWEAVIAQQLAERLPEIVAAAAGAFSKVDNLTVLTGVQCMGELMNQMIAQAGLALSLARETLGTARAAGATTNGRPADEDAKDCRAP